MLDSSGDALSTTIDGKAWQQNTSTTPDTFSFDGEVVDGGSIEIATGASATATVGIEDSNLESGTYTVTDISTDATYGSNWDVGLTDSSGNVVALGATDEIGTKAATAGAVTNWVDVNDTSSTLLGTTANPALATDDTIKVTGKGINVSTQETASDAIDTLDKAIANVSSERSKLGAVQNRLDHTINNLNTAEENLTAAESRISDVDMAKEMMNMSKQQILSQAGTAMMAQANQLPQGVLQLLG
jgi:flagellin